MTDSPVSDNASVIATSMPAHDELLNQYTAPNRVLLTLIEKGYLNH
jgi:hypothetical protein